MARLVRSDRREVTRDLSGVIREPWPALPDRRGELEERRGTALSADGNGALVCAVSYLSFHPRLAQRERRNSCSSGQTWYRNGTEPVPPGRKRSATCTSRQGRHRSAVRLSARVERESTPDRVALQERRMRRANASRSNSVCDRKTPSLILRFWQSR